MRILITGANRGIGLEIAKKWIAEGAEVIACCRRASEELKKTGAEIVSDVDVTRSPSLENISRQLENRKLDLLILNAGVMKTDLRKESFLEMFEVNSIAPIVMTLALKEQLKKPSKVAIITSRMGSMADNTSGGAYGYRMSKAAVNAGAVSLAHDLKDDEVSVALIHPGYVQTDMTGGRGDLKPEESAEMIVERIKELDKDKSGQFFHANGQTLPW